MAINVSITPPASTSVSVGGTSSTSVSVASGATIEKKFFQSTVEPSANVNQGDLWYDLSLSKLKLRGSSSWASVGGSGEDLDGSFFKFTSDSALSSGNLAEFKNSTTTTLSLRYDGVVVLKDQASAPTAVANGLYSDGADLYHGTE